MESRVLHPPLDGPRATVTIRLMAGAVFLWEGILNFVYANQGWGDGSPSSGCRSRRRPHPSWAAWRS